MSGKYKSYNFNSFWWTLLNRPINDFKNITIEEALKHPNWEMGKKFLLIVQH